MYGSTVLMASMLIVKIVGAVFKIPLTNILHESGMGYFNSAYTIYTTVYALTVTGLSAAVARMVAENAAKKRFRDVRKMLKLSTRVFVVTGIVGALIIAFSAGAFSRGIDSENSYWTVVMIAPAILFCCLMASYRGYYEGLSDMVPTAVTQVVEVLIKLITGLLFANLVINLGVKQFNESGMVFGLEVATQELAVTASIPYAAAGAMLGVSVSTFVGFLYIFIKHKLSGDYITKQMLVASPKPMRTKVLLWRLIKIAIPITMGAVVLQLAALIDTFTIMNRLSSLPLDGLMEKYGQFVSENEIMSEFLYGCFSSTITLFNLVPAFTNIFGKSALPNVTEAWTEHDPKKVKSSIESVIRVTLLVGAPMGFGLSFMAEPVLRLLYKNLEGAIMIGAPLLAVFGIAALCLSVVTPMNAIFQGIGRMDLPVKFLVVGAIIKFVLNFALIGIPSINIFGSAISTICCYAVIVVLGLHYLRKCSRVPLNYKSILLKPTISGFFCGFSAYLCNFALTKWIEHSIITVISIAFGAFVYLIFLGLFNAISKDDILMLPKGKKILKVLEKVRIVR